jgi:uncharacterized membrane protein YtjA (UPF0391 family)
MSWRDGTETVRKGYRRRETLSRRHFPGETPMLRWAIIFLIISIVAGAFGYINISEFTRRISIVLFALFFIGFLVFLGLALLVVDAASTPLILSALIAE